MYSPRNLLMPDLPTQHNFIQQFGFAMLVTDDLQVSHIPLFLLAEEGELGTLYGHVAKANPQWHVLEKSKVKVVFSGPHSYISPSWYATRPAVPTWNYAALHVTGRATLLDAEQNMQALHTLVNQYEPRLLFDKATMPDTFQQKLSSAIVGFKISIQHIVGKQKLGQQRPAVDQQGTVKGLEQSPHPDAKSLLAYMQKTGLGLGID
ncbi:MAG: FMN-binding negative transcriptional regulator [Paraglaciecola sp.]|nr:FMN-binding negative transcriptional regulator [Paraglaciecola sp.]NCT47580.1 FMN-binding negative transcriptional regulator [Paraglaciecola sp.]